MRQRLIALIGILIVLLVVFTLLRPKSKMTALKKEIKPRVKQETLTVVPKKEIKETPVITPVKKEGLRLSPVTMKEAEEDAEKWGEDPFVREFSYISEIKDLMISAITISENEAYAIINNQIVQVGDVIDGKKVVAIEKDRVIVEKGGKRFTVFLSE